MSSVISQVGEEGFPIAPLMVSLRVSMSHIPLKDPSRLLIMSTLKQRWRNSICHIHTFSDTYMQWKLSYMDTLGDQNNCSDKWSVLISRRGRTLFIYIKLGLGQIPWLARCSYSGCPLREGYTHTVTSSVLVESAHWQIWSQKGQHQLAHCTTEREYEEHSCHCSCLSGRQLRVEWTKKQAETLPGMVC